MQRHTLLRLLRATLPTFPLGLFLFSLPACSSAPDARPAAEPTGSTSQAIYVDPWLVNVGAFGNGEGDGSVCAIAPGIGAGALWCWGDNRSGQLGNGTKTPAANPTYVGGAWTSVESAEGYTCALAAGGSISCWGYFPGQGDTLTPTTFAPGTTWRQLSVGAGDNPAGCAIKSDQTLWCWGDNTWGQAGNGTQGSGLYYSSPQPVAGGMTWNTVAVAGDHTCGITTAGQLYCWGFNDFGQLGLGNNTQFNTPQLVSASTGWTSVTAGGIGQTCAIQGGNGYTEGGTLWCWGATPTGQTLVPTQVGASSAWISISTGGSVTYCGLQASPATYATSAWCWGVNMAAQCGVGYTSSTVATPTQVQGQGSASWSSISTNGLTTCAASHAGVSCWGDNSDGLIGDGVLSPPSYYQPTPANTWYWDELAAFNGSTCGMHTDGTLWCWGGNVSGQAAQGYESSTPIEAPAQVGTQTWENVKASSDGSHACAIRSDSTLWCWGANGSGQLGNGVTGGSASQPTQVNSSTGWDAVAPGLNHTCGIWEYELWCWGDNTFGELGLGNETPSSTTRYVPISGQWGSIAAGDFATCAIRIDGTLWCWGYNGVGAIGQGSTAKTFYPSPTQVGTATSWNSVSMGGFSVCAQRTDGSLWCWGNNPSGQLGVGDYAIRTAPTEVGAPFGWGPPAVGSQTTCATWENEVWCWGSNTYGIAGQGSTSVAKYPYPVMVGGWDNWITVSVGADQACLSDGVAYCMGNDENGQLGIGSLQAESVPTQVE